MSEILFVDLPEYIGVIKRRFQANDPFVYGFIVAVSENDDCSKNRIVLFKQEGAIELHKLRIAAFEMEGSLIKELEKISQLPENLSPRYCMEQPKNPVEIKIPPKLRTEYQFIKGPYTPRIPTHF